MGIWSAMVVSCAYSTIERFCVDKGYRGTFIYDAYALLHCHVDISDNIKSDSRRLDKDYEIRTNSAEAMIKLSHIHTLLKHL